MATVRKAAPKSAPTPYDGFDRMPVDGAWRHGRGKPLEDRDPYTNDVLVEIPPADGRDLDEAFRAAAAQTAWAGTLPSERAAVLRRAAAVMEARREEIVGWLVRESDSTRIKANVEWQAPLPIREGVQAGSRARSRPLLRHAEALSPAGSDRVAGA